MNSVNYSALWGLLQDKVYKIRITDLHELKQRLRMEWTKLNHASLWQPFISVVVEIPKKFPGHLPISPAVSGGFTNRHRQNKQFPGVENL